MLKNLRKKSKKKGFTLIELVIVLAVLAIIALIAIPNFTKVKENATTQADEINCEQVENITKLAVSEGILKSEEATFTIKVGAGDDIARITVGGKPKYGFDADGTEYKADALQTRFVDVEKPQGKGHSGYNIEIKASGVVIAETAAIN